MQGQLLYNSDFVTCASCIFCASFCLWDAQFYFGESEDAIDLPLKKVFWIHKFVVGLIDMGNSESYDP